MARNKLPFDYRTHAGIYLSSFVRGDVTVQSNDDVVIDATVSGSIHTAGFCEITENGAFEGDITARSLVIFGATNGDNTASDTMEVKRSANIKGVYSSPSIHIEPGALVSARIHHTDARSSGPL
ncbi:polymer-forming cytoskeletal protein [bacterium]|nr:polymer-forming cytoskeletal protein [bacterium]